MDASLWVAKTGLDAQQTRMNVISNNLANVSTTGFKRDRAVFEDLLYQNVKQPGGQTTNNTLSPTGLMLGTGVKINNTGQVVTASGFPLLPNITIPDNTASVTFGQDGTVSAEIVAGGGSQNIGQIQIARFVNPSGLKPVGNNLFEASQASGVAQVLTPGLNGAGALKQGSLEASNVNVVEEMVNMIETQRAYEINSKAISSVDGMLKFLNQNI